MRLKLASTFLFSFLLVGLEPFSEKIMAQESIAIASATTGDIDPFLWLEDVTGEKAIEWVKARNAKSQAKMEADPKFNALREDLLAILDSDARIPFVGKQGEYYYNFWRDKKNERGLWRRTSLTEFKKTEPKWEVILDLDSLGKAENENWVWKGANLLRPDYKRALVTLSRGGADADVTREFDMDKREFIKDGFARPESKGSMRWIDLDHVFVMTDFGSGSMTESGYPRIAKKWKRGTPFESAEVVYEGKNEDMSVGAFHDDSPGFERNFVTRNLAFYNDELYLLDDKSKLIQVDVPNSARKSVFHQYLAIELRKPWEVGGKTYPAGALLMTNFDAFLKGERNLDMVFEPSDTTALSSSGFTKNFGFINVLEDVKNRIYVLKPTPKGWVREPLKGVPSLGTVNISAVDSDESNDFFMTATNYLNPTTLSLGTIGSEPTVLKQLPAFFDAKGLAISQHFATSKDGTRIPYFMVASDTLKLDSNNPTLLYGYGGFEISMQPGYSPTVGRAWVSQGGVYVVANIRGGGEYGPRWHQAAL